MGNFEEERHLIGKGRMADVYMWNGYAYKCFKKDYPDEWIEYEKDIMKKISNEKLPADKYFDSDIPRSIKMEYIDGCTLAERMRKEKYKDGLKDLIDISEEIHNVHGMELQSIEPMLEEAIANASIKENIREMAKDYLNQIPQMDTLCHLDYHFENIMYSDKGYTVIDWINAKNGNPVFDYARTYVIMYEFIKMFSKTYLKMLYSQKLCNEEDMKKAVLIMAIHRLSEFDDPKVREIIDGYDKE